MLIEASLGRRGSTLRRPIYARPDPYPRPPFSRRQRHAFDPEQPFSRLVNEAILQEQDYTLIGEVTAYRRAWQLTRGRAMALIQAKKRFNDAQQALDESATHLANAN